MLIAARDQTVRSRQRSLMSRTFTGVGVDAERAALAPSAMDLNGKPFHLRLCGWF